MSSTSTAIERHRAARVSSQTSASLKPNKHAPMFEPLTVNDDSNCTTCTMTPRTQHPSKRTQQPQHTQPATQTQTRKRKPATAQSTFQSSFQIGPTPPTPTSTSTSTPSKRPRGIPINPNRAGAFHWTTTPPRPDAQHSHPLSAAGRQFDFAPGQPSTELLRRRLAVGSHLTLTQPESRSQSAGGHEGQPLSTLQSHALPSVSYHPPSTSAQDQSPQKKRRRQQPA